VFLVDTSVWVEHFKKESSRLAPLLLEGQVLTHQFILGELSLGHFHKKDRNLIFERLSALDVVPTSPHAEVFDFSMKHKLAGKGIGWIDCHLLHAVNKHKIPLLSLDKNLIKLSKYFSSR
jgi:hypothetical protein